MARLNFRDCIPYAFKPIVAASRRTDLIAKLKLLPPADDIRAGQFKRFADFRAQPGAALPLPNGGFFLKYRSADSTCIAFSSYVDDLDLDSDLSAWLYDNEAFLEGLDQALFLFLAYTAQPHFSIRPNFRNRRQAQNIVEIAESNNYEGIVLMI
jgi:hypothetical protein